MAIIAITARKIGFFAKRNTTSATIPITMQNANKRKSIDITNTD